MGRNMQTNNWKITWYHMMEEGQMTPRGGKRVIREERTPDLNPRNGEGIFQAHRRARASEAEE